jgi:hypothetical protein
METRIRQTHNESLKTVSLRKKQRWRENASQQFNIFLLSIIMHFLFFLFSFCRCCFIFFLLILLIILRSPSFRTLNVFHFLFSSYQFYISPSLFLSTPYSGPIFFYSSFASVFSVSLHPTSQRVGPRFFPGKIDLQMGVRPCQSPDFTWDSHVFAVSMRVGCNAADKGLAQTCNKALTVAIVTPTDVGSRCRMWLVQSPYFPTVMTV